MQTLTNATAQNKMRLDAADLEVSAQLGGDGSAVIRIMKSGTCVHQLTIGDASTRMEHSWLADLFAREDRVLLSALSRQADEYLSTLDIRQG